MKVLLMGDKAVVVSRGKSIRNGDRATGDEK
jgi:hypothetical protein